MKALLRILLCGLTIDLFFFSSVFNFTRGVNSKLILAVLGLALFIYNSFKSKSLNVSRQMILLTILAAGVSLASLFAMVYNNTGDDAYLTYAISMLVWLSAAYLVICVIKAAYGDISVERIANYIIAITVIQCTIAILAYLYVPVNGFVKALVPGTGWLDSIDRMYGLGETTALDTGGIRYSIACIFCAYMLVKSEKDGKSLAPWYLFALFFIIIIGNMIARTTSIGSVLALVYIFLYLFPGNTISVSKLRTAIWMMIIILIMVIISVWLYDSNELIHKNLRFAFEGFFNLVEEGEWRVNSNDKLRTMYIWPDNLKTWLIGDGYFSNPAGDLNYLGDLTEGYYMNTDVGYLRFIYYFGLLGLSFFSFMILFAGKICRMRFPENNWLFVIFTLLNFIIWFKVSTDCFFILAVFIAMGYVRSLDIEYEKNVPSL